MKQGKIRQGGLLVDVGGGIGDLVFATKKELLFGRGIVADISRKNLEAAASKVGLENTMHIDVDKEGLRGLADSEVDVVTALDFIEHIIDPEKFARECHRVLRSGGEVFINTPNIRYWQHIEQLWMQGRFPHTSGDRDVYHGGHLAFFTFADLREIFEAAGFMHPIQIKDEEGFQTPPSPFLSRFNPGNQADYVKLQLEFGCPNLLFKATKP
jgi:2-polyprenyl-3-methyl-5-hydroxy-6-metoxy-1,4-benzoquinol methylase